MKRNIFITGCTSGLGRALVDRFAEDGHQVVGCGTNQETIDEMKRHYPFPHLFRALDVTAFTTVEEWAGHLKREGFVPDLLINNAGVINPNSYFWNLPTTEFDRVIDVNVKGVANVMRAFLPIMITQKKGILVNISSGWGRSVSAEVVPYCTSKWAIEGLTKAVAEELPEGLAAIPVNPGVINTRMLQSCYGEAAAGYSSAEEWSYRAAPFLLGLGVKQNGVSLTV